MLRRIKLQNFKCFENLDLACAPLNLLCGLNGMGKSSVIQALLVLRQSFETGDLREGRLVLGGALTDLGAGSDVLFEDAAEEAVEFALACQRQRSKSSELATCPVTGEPTRGIFAPGADAKAKSVLNRLLSSAMKESELGSQVKDVGAFRRAFAQANRAGVDKVQRPSEYFDPIVTLGWWGAFRYSRAGDQLTAVEREEAADHAFAPWRDDPPFGGRLVYAQAERVGPRKFYPLSEVLARRGELGAHGEYAWNFLNDHQDEQLAADDPRRQQASGRRMIDVVDHWLQDVSPGAHLKLEAVLAADAVIAGFAFDRPGDVTSQRHRATNVGFGLSYVLPVVLALLSEPGTLCLIENPEAHLHPRGQTKLAELAARAAAAGVQVFAETHSDHFLDGVRLAVRDGLIGPDQTAIHYFERRNGTTTVTSPEIDADGFLPHWPDGFFDQRDDNLARLLRPRG